MNSQEGAVCGSIGEPKGLLPASCCAMEVYCSEALVGGMSSDEGDDARVVPEHRLGTSEFGDATFGTCSHWIEIDGKLPPPEKLSIFKSSTVKVAGIDVSRLR